MISPSTSFFFIFGNPVEHSMSPLLHNFAFNHFSIDAVYLAAKIEDIKKAMMAVKTLGIKGVNITTPHKADAIKYADIIESGAAAAGSVNTVKNNNGIIECYNTDISGSMLSLKKSYGNIKGKSVTVFGTGGAARGIITGLLMEEAGEIIIVGRDIKKAQSMISELKNNLKKDFCYHVFSSENIEHEIQGDIIINATTAGLTDNNKSIPFFIKSIENYDFVMDIIYGKDTEILKSAKNKGINCIDGQEMLLNQAAISFNIWTEKPIEETYNVMKKSLQRHI